MKRQCFGIFFFAAAGFGWLSALAGPVQTPYVEAELVAENTGIVPGQPFTVALRLKMDEHWHTYWENPGDSGLPTTVDWTLPDGFSAGPLQWPHPERLPLDFLVNFGYEGEVLLLTEIVPPAGLPSGSTTVLEARADWLVCKEICLPGGADLSLTLPVVERAAADPAWTEAFAAARARLPVRSEAWEVEAGRDGENLVLRWTPRAGQSLPADLVFFPVEEGVIEPAAPQRLARRGGSLFLETSFTPYAGEDIARLRGVAVAPGGWDGVQGAPPALDIDVALGSASALIGAVDSGPVAGTTAILLGMVGFAFVGGLILNLMPCVFPVISIKIFSFVRQAGEDRGAVARHGWAFAAGVLVSFWVLAGLLLLIRAGGEQLGWGYQLQSPGFVIFLCFVLLAFALSLMGVFEVGGSLTGLAGKAGARTGLSGSFMTGVLATILATPCTAPFMGPALAFALTQPAWTSLLVFSFLGAGMAAPYVVLSLSPALLRFLPKPGAWMETFKQLMAFPLLATIIWLLWVLGLQVGIHGLALAMLGLLIGALGLWALGRWSAPVRPARTRLAARLATLLLLAAGGAVAFAGAGGQPAGDLASGRGSLEWVRFAPDQLADLRARGTPVFIDFTAAWCATCQVNEAVVFGSREVREKLAEKEVVLMKADWTRRDPVITEALASYGKSAVPLYVLYGQEAGGGPVLVRELLTPGTLLDALEMLR